MDWFKICSDYYSAGFYNEITLKTFVEKGKITPEQYKDITGSEY